MSLAERRFQETDAWWSNLGTTTPQAAWTHSRPEHTPRSLLWPPRVKQGLASWSHRGSKFVFNKTKISIYWVTLTGTILSFCLFESCIIHNTFMLLNITITVSQMGLLRLAELNRWFVTWIQICRIATSIEHYYHVECTLNILCF